MTMPNSGTSHPLAASLKAVRSLNKAVAARVGPPAGPDWYTPEAFVNADLLAARRERAERVYGARSPVMVANLLLTDYGWIVLSTALACYSIDRRVPALANIHVHCTADAEYADGLSLPDGRFAALPDDEAASHPDATVLPDASALRQHLRLTVERCMRRIIDLLCQRLSVRAVSLWPTVADRCAGTLIWLGDQLEMTNTAIRADVHALIDAPGSPLNNPATGLLAITAGEDTRLFLKRATCCQVYRRGEDYDYCDTCPRLPVEERIERLRERAS